MKIKLQEPKRIVITVNQREYDNFKSQKRLEGKSGQFLGYRALEKAGLFKPLTKDSLK